ncbi:hypothetical protein FB461_0607 [Rarobacter faecitabidus]|uniref:Uncharacterized protein n=1 Tax=Rarobacter faecitabidus TaxID=13243 RepID=A0A542ZUU6_RARFA|nr:hypothetical protein FB461_0607 [Rarobacter faecitabidus]
MRRVFTVTIALLTLICSGCILGDPEGTDGYVIAYGVNERGEHTLLIQNNCSDYPIYSIEIGSGIDFNDKESVAFTITEAPIGLLEIDLNVLPEYAEITKGNAERLPILPPFYARASVIDVESKRVYPESTNYFAYEPSVDRAIIFDNDSRAHRDVPFGKVNLSGVGCS